MLAELDGAKLRDSVAGNRLKFFVRDLTEKGEGQQGCLEGCDEDEVSREGSGPSATQEEVRDERDEGDLDVVS